VDSRDRNKHNEKELETEAGLQNINVPLHTANKTIILLVEIVWKKF